MKTFIKYMVIFTIFNSLISCTKEINFKTIDNAIDDKYRDYELISFNEIKVINKEELYKIMIEDLNKRKGESKTASELADLYKKMLSKPDFDRTEIFTEIEYSYFYQTFEHHKIGYFNNKVEMIYSIDIERPILN